MNRSALLQALQATSSCDILVIGGGATGLGAALDAASRGFHTVLLEKSDFGKGTSSRSTKLVHGGVRYLRQGNIRLVREALHERGLLLQNAPHRTRIQDFVMPVHHWWERPVMGTGLKAYEWLSGKWSLGNSTWVSRSATLESIPGLEGSSLYGGIRYFDGQFDDAGLAIDLARTAESFGALLVNYTACSGFRKSPNGKLEGVYWQSELEEATGFIAAKAVINATGVFADSIFQLDEPTAPPRLAPSQGVHLVVDAHHLGGSSALMVPKTDDGRVLFAVPWYGKVILGTTDIPIEKVQYEPKASEAEIGFILRNAARYLKDPPKKADLLSVYTGLRPLVKAAPGQKSAELSRDHAIWIAASGLISILGGKWTTYRKMAQEVVDKALVVAQLPHAQCQTAKLPITSPPEELLHENQEFITQESIHWWVEHGWVNTVEDVLSRRKRILLLDARKALAVAPLVASHLQALGIRDPQLASFQTMASSYLPEF